MKPLLHLEQRVALHNSLSNYFELQFLAIKGSAEVSLENSSLSAWWPKRFQFDAMSVLNYDLMVSSGQSTTIWGRHMMRPRVVYVFSLCDISCTVHSAVFYFNQFPFASHRFALLKTITGAPPHCSVIFFRSGCRYKTQSFWLISVAQWPQHKFTEKIAETIWATAKPKANRLTLVIHTGCIGISRSVAERLSNFLQHNSEKRNLQFTTFCCHKINF